MFPLQGRFDPKRLPLPYRLIMKVKTADIAKRPNAKAAKTTLTPAEQACSDHGDRRPRRARYPGRHSGRYRPGRGQQLPLQIPEPKVC
ncbi:MAG: hypothetical protein ACLSHG_10035 [Oscillospiraceae bacterium]